MMKEIKYWAVLLLAGMVIAGGMRVTEYLIPSPKREVIHKVDDESKCLRQKNGGQA